MMSLSLPLLSQLCELLSKEVDTIRRNYWDYTTRRLELNYST